MISKICASFLVTCALLLNSSLATNTTSKEEPMEFGGEMGLTVFCKNVASSCIFPFTYNNVTYNSCTTDDMDQSEGENKWCATAVDIDGNMIEGHFGLCNNCTEEEPPAVVTEEIPDEPSAQVSEPKEITVKILRDSNPNGICGEIKFSQQDPDSALTISGVLSGLAPGLHGFHVHQNPELGNNCVDAGPHFNPFRKHHGGPDSEERHVGDFGNIEANERIANISITLSGASLFPGENSILGLPIVIHDVVDDLGQNPDDPDSLTTGSSGSRLACALIQDVPEEDNTLLIIIIVIIVLILLIIIVSILICYCMKKRKSKIREKVPQYDDPGFDYPNGDACKKSPLYDELSIPFIDASPAPTPKTGRSTERLSFFNRTPSIGRSRGSLSNEDK